MTDQAFLVNPNANQSREIKTIKAASAYRTISEAAEELGIPQHVLRFWETKFSQIRPMKRSGGRRFYRPEDIELIRTIQSLLYDQGYTIKGVQRLLKMRRASALAEPYAMAAAPLVDMLDSDEEKFNALAPAAITLKPVIETGFTPNPAQQAAATVVQQLADELTGLTDDLAPQTAFDLFANTPTAVLEQIPDHLPLKPARLMATGLAAGHPLPTALAEELVITAESTPKPAPQANAPSPASGLTPAEQQQLTALLDELKALKALLD